MSHTFKSLRALAVTASMLAAHLRGAASKAAGASDRWSDEEANAALVQARTFFSEIEAALVPAMGLCEDCEAREADRIADQALAARMAEVEARPLVDTATGEVHPPRSTLAGLTNASDERLLDLARDCDQAFLATHELTYDVRSVFQEAAATARAIVSGELAQLGNIALAERYAEIVERTAAGEPIAEIRKTSEQGFGLLQRLARAGCEVPEVDPEDVEDDEGMTAHDRRFLDHIRNEGATQETDDQAVV